MTWGLEPEDQRAKFQEVVLPPGYLDQPADTVIGITRKAPEVAPAESAPRTAARTTGATAGHETWRRKLAPRHRRVVREYFRTK
ncbi:MAG: hypothetical protein GXP27_03450 [Planctomycetes bacterium]|nr:hypothetical protein [Planctomycetota bacterium]